jgi:predicted ATPase
MKLPVPFILEQGFILTGTMGSGKTTLLNELSKRVQTVPEAARTILAEQRSFNGFGVPERDPSLFCELLLSRTLQAYKIHQSRDDIVIFDRGIPDLIAYAELFGLATEHYYCCAELYRYQPKVFILEPWPEIYENDDERKMTLQQSLDFHQILVKHYQALNYQLILVPKLSPIERAKFILTH